jgi:DNA-binding transcriptional MerR regulator
VPALRRGRLLRLHRVRHLQPLGLSLDSIKGVLGEPSSGIGLRDVLEVLLAEIEGQLGTLERRRDRIREVLARGTSRFRKGSRGP